MSTQSKKAAEATTKGAQAATSANTVPNPEQLQKRIHELETLLKQKQPQSIDDAIAFYQAKKRKIDDLATFEQHSEILKQAAAKISEKVNAGELDAKVYTLKMTVFSDYREGDKVFSLTNPVVIEACILEMLQKVKHSLGRRLKHEKEPGTRNPEGA